MNTWQDNLETIKDFLIENQNNLNFNMLKYSSDCTPMKHTCNSTCCVVGYAATLPSILPILDRHVFTDGKYWNYTTFANTYLLPKDHTITIFSFLFSMQWVYTDNTPLGAARRIEFLLANGTYTVCKLMNNCTDAEIKATYERNTAL